MSRDHVLDSLDQWVRVGDRVAAAVNSWNGPNLVVGRVERITEKRTVLRVETHTSRLHEATSTIDDSLKRFIRLPEVAA
ncbi:hypothetical protein MTE01_29030 [Microbacterium testaceum]|uniref:Uncharacterized protein n=1 Tax=Microbacterium testaceum TaxID=2033 RepID=A0A4Y3QRC4_MICTE|nr:hypothetical protein [Microbacterium testaceum]GEB46958.1 hypothetical protein MTE01_29030 [Microbacterium testaceum]